MEHIAELGGIVTGFNVTEQYIDCMCGKNLIKIDKYSRDIICQKTVFEKEGLSRKLPQMKSRFLYTIFVDSIYSIPTIMSCMGLKAAIMSF